MNKKRYNIRQTDCKLCGNRLLPGEGRQKKIKSQNRYVCRLGIGCNKRNKIKRTPKLTNIVTSDHTPKTTRFKQLITRLKRKFK